MNKSVEGNPLASFHNIGGAIHLNAHHVTGKDQIASKRIDINVVPQGLRNLGPQTTVLKILLSIVVHGPFEEKNIAGRIPFAANRIQKECHALRICSLRTVLTPPFSFAQTDGRIPHVACADYWITSTEEK